MRRLAGYRLHLRRLRISGQPAIRTIKFPIGDYHKNNKSKSGISLNEDHLDLANRIRSDYEKLYGCFNLTTYTSDSDIYSLKNFYIDCLRMGAVMKHSAAKLVNDLRIISGDQDRIDEKQKKLIQAKNSVFFSSINFDKLKSEVINSKEFRSTKTSLNIFNEKTDKTEKWGKEILGATVGKKRKDQDAYWKDTYGVDKTLYRVVGSQETTFYLLPEVKSDDNLDPIDVIENLERYIRGKVPNYNNKNISEYIGLLGSKDGLSQVFGKILNLLQSGEINSIIESFNSVSSIWRDNEAELRSRLEFLSKRSKLLGEPKLVAKWSDYRTDFGGKIQSWISNGLRQDETIREHLFGGEFYAGGNSKATEGHVHDLVRLESEFDNPPLSNYGDADYLRGLCSQMAKSLDNMRPKGAGKRVHIEQLNDYRNMLADLKTRLNQIYQPTDKARGSKSADEIYKKIFRELPRVPSFIGDSKSGPDGVYEKYIRSKIRMNAGFDLLGCLGVFDDHLVVDDLAKYEAGTQKSLQVLLSIWRRTGSDSNVGGGTGQSDITSTIAGQIIGKALGGRVENNLQNIGKSDYLFRAPQSKDKRGEKLKLKPGVLGPQGVGALIGELRVDWGKYRDSEKYLSEWPMLLEVEKVRLGLITQTYDLGQTGVYDLLNSERIRDLFPGVRVVFARFEESQRSSNLSIGTVMQQAVLSELKGTASKMTTKKIVARYVLQPMDSEKKFPILTDRSDYGKERKSGQSYYIGFPALGDNGLSGGGSEAMRSVAQKIIGDKTLKAGRTNKDRGKMFRLNSSKYQLQFFDNSFSGHWKDYAPKISSYSLVYEEDLDISWPASGNCPVITTSESKRLFVSVPFNVSGEGSPAKIDRSVRPAKFLGVDIGEYGVATYVLDANNFESHGQASFIYDSTLRKIRYGLNLNKIRQKAGTFSFPSTYLKRLRDNATKNIRNRIHAIVVSSDARPVYEWEVSNFESGSGKISKIYDSIKKSDVPGGASIDKLERNLTWGKGYLSMGYNTSAYATSYCCSHCHSSIYALIDSEDRDKDYEIKEVLFSSPHKAGSDKFDNRFKALVDNRLVWGHSNSNHKLAGGDKITGGQVVVAARKYARPPLETVLAEDDGLKVAMDRLSSDQREAFKLQSGNQAVFRCPFADRNCGLADADIQAALWIALKGHLDVGLGDKKLGINPDPNIAPHWSKEASKKSRIAFMLSYAKDMKVPPIEMDINQRVSVV